MRHLKKRRILSREKPQRESLLSGLASALFIYKKIETTLAKAKEMKPFAEKLITRAKVNKPARIRLISKKLPKQASKELFEVIAPACLNRKGGYIRIIRKSFRKSDGASMALVELVDFPKGSDLEKDSPKVKKEKHTSKKKVVSQDAKKQEETSAQTSKDSA